MSVVIIKDKVTPKDLKVASQDYGEYIKVVIDIETEMAAIGGQWHADGEAELLKLDSKQKNIWGGGLDLKRKIIETSALINIRPRQGNASQEILDLKIKEKFTRIVKDKFGI